MATQEKGKITSFQGKGRNSLPFRTCCKMCSAHANWRRNTEGERGNGRREDEKYWERERKWEKRGWDSLPKIFLWITIFLSNIFWKRWCSKNNSTSTFVSYHSNQASSSFSRSLHRTSFSFTFTFLLSHFSYFFLLNFSLFSSLSARVSLSLSIWKSFSLSPNLKEFLSLPISFSLRYHQWNVSTSFGKLKEWSLSTFYFLSSQMSIVIRRVKRFKMVKIFDENEHGIKWREEEEKGGRREGEEKGERRERRNLLCCSFSDVVLKLGSTLMPGNTIEKNEKETESQVWASCFDATSFQEMGEGWGNEGDREREREGEKMEIEGGNWLYRLFEGGVWEKNPFFFLLLLVSKKGRKSIHFFLVEEEKRNEIEKRECWRILRT